MRNIVILLSFITMVSFAQKETGGDISSPNIVFILADDMGIGDISALNPEGKIATPNIDKLISNGMTFTDAHTASSVCTPTRYGILTGRYPWRTKLKKGVLNGYSRSLISDSTDTAPALLKRNGYKTALIGKWHLGWDWTIKENETAENDKTKPYNYSADIEKKVDFTKPFTGGPTDRGFDYFYGISASLDFPPYVFCENNRVASLPDSFFDGPSTNSDTKLQRKQKMQRKGAQSNDFEAAKSLLRITEHSVDYIKQQDQLQPFFLYVSFTAPHTPVLPRKEFAGSSKAGIYGDFIQELDWSVGEIIKALKEKGMTDNTLVIFTADNGASRISFPIEFEKTYQHKPSRELRGRKGSLHEGGHHVPFIAQWPKVVSPASKSNATICLNDLYATYAALVHAENNDHQGVDSFSILDLLKGNDKNYQRTSTVYSNFGGRFSIRKGDWKLDLNSNPKKRNLFNLKDDRSEKHNLYARKNYQGIEEDLTKEISAIITNGRSTHGPRLKNCGEENWPQLYWIEKPKKIKVFFLAGQSNMDGRARAYHLSDEDLKRLKKAQENVTLYYNHQAPVPLQPTTPPTHVQQKFDTKQIFGPELFFGIEMSEAYPDHDIILIKRSRGGMSLYGAWNPNWTEEKAKTMNEENAPKLYSDFIAYAHEVLKDYDPSEYELCGMLWVQGETDSGTKKFGTIAADTYEANLKNLIQGVRSEFSSPELPFIIFQVGNEKVVQAMRNISNEDKNVTLIPQEYQKESEYYFPRNPSPLGHYTYESMKRIGEYFSSYYQNEYVTNNEE